MLIPEELSPLLKLVNLYKNKKDFYNSLKDKYITKNLRIDPFGYIEYMRKIPVSEVQLKESIEDLPHKELIEKYMKMPIETMPPILVFGKRHKNDTYQVYDGHHRLIATKMRGMKYIDAWITMMDKNGCSVTLKNIYDIFKKLE